MANSTDSIIIKPDVAFNCDDTPAPPTTLDPSSATSP
jgi:hypothetical protein